MIELLSFDFGRRALIAGVVVGVMCAVLAFFVVLRRMAFAGAGISHAALGGVAIGLVLGVMPLVTAMIVAVAVAWMIGWISERGGTSEETALGVLFPTAMAIGVAVMSTSSTYRQDLMAYLFGSILAVRSTDLWLSCALAVGSLALVGVFFKELVFLSIDEDAARAAMIPVRKLRFLLLTVLATTIVASIKLVGVILVSALLVVPAAIGQRVARSMSGMLVVSITSAVAAVVGGLWASWTWNLPPGASIVIVSAALFFATLLRRAGKVAAVVVALLGVAVSTERAEAAETPSLEVYVRPGCGHCDRAKEYLRDLEARRPELRITMFDVAADPKARDRLHMLADRHGTLVAVPAFVVGDRLTVGFDHASTTGAMLESWLDDAQGELDVIELPLVGRLRVRDIGLPAFSLVLGLVDGFNPCAMWVLLFLLSLLVNLRSRRRMLYVGGTFVLVSAIAYYAFITAWLGMFLWIGISRWLQASLGLVAIAAGLLHIKDCVWPHHGPSLSIPERAKPTIYARVRRIVYAENLSGALVAAATLALAVNLVELLCTAGLPALFAQILSAHGLSWWEHHAYLALYVLAYMFDDALMLAIAVITLSRRKVQERAGRVLKLVSGGVMVALGMLLLLRPEWLVFR